jgi:arginase
VTELRPSRGGGAGAEGVTLRLLWPQWQGAGTASVQAEDDIANVAQWGIRAFSPDELRATTQPLGAWLAATGCSRVAIHFDVDTIDSNELVLGLGAEPDGLTTAQVRRIVEDLDAVAEVVGLTVAEFIPRQVMHLQQLLTAFPLLRQVTGQHDNQ